MANYALITGTGSETVELYRELARREGLEPVVVGEPEEARDALTVRGRPRLVLADLTVSSDAGFQVLRAIRSSSSTGEPPVVLAAVSRELMTTADDLMDALGITEVLPMDANASAMAKAVRRAIAQVARPATDLCPPPPFEDDLERTGLARIAATGLDEGTPEKALENLLVQTAEAFGAPIALVSLSHDDGHWFKSHVAPSGGEIRGISFDASFCRYVVESGQAVLVSDTTMHPTFAANPLVRSGVVGTFAGAPLATRDNDAFGALCILDPKPGAIAPARVDVLARFARRVTEEFELRSKARSSALEVIRLNEKLAKEREKHDVSRTVLAQAEAVLSQLETGIIVVDRERQVTYANVFAGELLDMPAQRMMGMLREDLLRELSRSFDDPDTLLGKLAPARAGLKAFSCEVDHERPVPRRMRWTAKPVELPGGIGQLITVVELEKTSSRQVSGRYSVVPPLASTRPARAVGAPARAAGAPARAAGRGGKRKG